jgi:endonuclease YncB( thermonuclease family)
MNRKLLFLLTVGLSLAVHSTQYPLQKAIVLDVRDGDTIDVRFEEGERDSIRYVGISAPELNDCFGEEAKGANENVVLQKDVWLEKNPKDGGYERDRNRRILAYVWSDPDRNALVQTRLVQEGYALLDPNYVTDDPEAFSARYAGQIIEAQVKTARERLGWWGACDLYKGSDIVVAAVKYWGDNEVVYIVNRGSTSVDLGQGWVLWDDSGSDRNKLAFSKITGPSCLLPPGGMLRVYSGPDVPENKRKTHTPCNEVEIDLYWTGRKIWNNDKDVAYLSNSGDNLVHKYKYPPFE